MSNDRPLETDETGRTAPDAPGGCGDSSERGDISGQPTESSWGAHDFNLPFGSRGGPHDGDLGHRGGNVPDTSKQSAAGAARKDGALDRAALGGGGGAAAAVASAVGRSAG